MYLFTSILVSIWFLGLTPLQSDDEGSKLKGIESKIISLVNEHRIEAGLSELKIHDELSELANLHSKNMGKNNFISHRNRLGKSPSERINERLGDRYFLVHTSENLAHRYFFGDPPLSSERKKHRIARSIVRGWMNSKGHYENLMNENSSHMGIGLHLNGNRLYVTQKFMAYLVRLAKPSDLGSIPVDQARLTFFADTSRVKKDDLIFEIQLPDSTDMWHDSEYGWKRGMALIDSKWSGSDRFIIELPVDKYGPGNYTVRFRDSETNYTYNHHYQVTVTN